jgi:transcriptional regulator with GAF, ATPase, and Fis domain
MLSDEEQSDAAKVSRNPEIQIHDRAKYYVTKVHTVSSIDEYLHERLIEIEDRKQAEQRMRDENLALREEIDRSSMREEIVGSWKILRNVLVQVDKVAPTELTVLITVRPVQARS